ncbi:hypothetical protein TI01_1031 [Lysobacter sp. A03]|nr:hypothetical protein TI01_1031 [Lysobacter sp. A03]
MFPQCHFLITAARRAGLGPPSPDDPPPSPGYGSPTRARNNPRDMPCASIS